MKFLMESPLRWSDHMKLKPLDKNNMVRGSPKNNACWDSNFAEMPKRT
jgi:hypothetical protein